MDIEEELDVAIYFLDYKLKRGECLHPKDAIAILSTFLSCPLVLLGPAIKKFIEFQINPNY